MSKKKSKQLTTKDILREVSKYEKLKKIIFEDGRYTEIYEKFDPDKVDELINEFVSFLSEFEKYGEKIDLNNVNKYLFIHILKYFSKLIAEVPDDFKSRVIFYNDLLKSRYVRDLQKEFDIQELIYVSDTLNNRIQDTIKMIEVSDKVRKEFVEFVKTSKKIKNRDVLSNFFLNENKENEEMKDDKEV